MKYGWCLLLVWCSLAAAQSPVPMQDPTPRIVAERAQLQAERQNIEQTHQARNRECWQRFVVNACLSEVRRSRRAALDPIRARELALNVEERAWRTHLRDERLREKSEGARP